MFAAIWVATATLEIAGTLAGDWTWVAWRPGATSRPGTRRRRSPRATPSSTARWCSWPLSPLVRVAEPAPPCRHPGSHRRRLTGVPREGGRVRSGLMPAPETDYLEAILNANVYDVAIETPLQEAPLLSARLGNRLFLKREDLQPVFSFKLRGAYNKMSRLSAAELRRGVVAASAGNHAQGVALAAAAARHAGDDRDARDDAADQGRRGRRARRQRRARGRLVRRRLRRGDAHRRAAGSSSSSTPTTTPT